VLALSRRGVRAAVVRDVAATIGEPNAEGLRFLAAGAGDMIEGVTPSARLAPNESDMAAGPCRMECRESWQERPLLVAWSL